MFGGEEISSDNPITLKFGKSSTNAYFLMYRKICEKNIKNSFEINISEKILNEIKMENESIIFF
jgi:hypothetical protein